MGKTSSKPKSLNRREIDDIRIKMNLSESEVNRWYMEFIEDYPNGRMTLTDFKNIYKRYYPHGNVEKFAEYAFAVFDRNGGGTIDFCEFLSSLSVSRCGTPADKLQWVFCMYDINKDGVVSRDEMLQITQSIHDMLGHSDKSVQSPKARVEEIFAFYDEDGDGTIDVEEFIKSAKYDPTIRLLLNV